MLKGRNILLGITGSIAAYKSAFLTRLLIKEGANVKILMTPASREFITPLTLSTLSKNPVFSDFTEDTESGVWNNHVDFGLWADLMIIAPLSANTMSKMADGTCDNLLLATYLSARSPVFIAPAMDLDMFKHESTQNNLKTLEKQGLNIINPEEGELASGLEGVGRMAEPQRIIETLNQYLSKKLPLSGKRALVTAGPTFERIDPVRFIGNFSSGKMGFAIAHELAIQGAEVNLITGPSNQMEHASNINRINVESAAEMLEACKQVYENTDICVMAAAVADYRPKFAADQKIKKTEGELNIELEKTTDILKQLGERKNNQILVGFALETENEEANAKKKLEKKNLDFIVLNSLKNEGAGFGHDTNKIVILDSQNKKEEFELKSKTEVAKDIVRKIKTYL